MGCGFSSPTSVDHSTQTNYGRTNHTRNRRAEYDSEEEDVFVSGESSNEILSRGDAFETVSSNGSRPPVYPDMDTMRGSTYHFMIKPFKYNPNNDDVEPQPAKTGYTDHWDDHHVRMPCSPKQNDRPPWAEVKIVLSDFQQSCARQPFEFHFLAKTIAWCAGKSFDMINLDYAIQSLRRENRAHFHSVVLPNICELALNVDTICGESPPLLPAGSNESVTMSQKQAASLLACAFFCLFPSRGRRDSNVTQNWYSNPNFNRLYEHSSEVKIEKLRCIINYFQRITEKMPTGLLTFQRSEIPPDETPLWNRTDSPLCRLHLTTGRKIEDIPGVLQVDFANAYIGGGVLSSGIVQEEIRFTICPEMLVSILLCEKMREKECIFLIGCERFSSYEGYNNTFKFKGDFRDNTPKDNWGRKWCHVVAMDALYYDDKLNQYAHTHILRELYKAYAAFRPIDSQRTDRLFGIATGNWGCGAFNGNKQLKAIIQLIAASEARRPLVYAAFGDRKLILSFAEVYNHLVKSRATTRDLFNVLIENSDKNYKGSLFKAILASEFGTKVHS